MQPRFENAGGGAPDPPPDPNLVFVLNLLLFGCFGYWLLGQRAKAVIAAIAWAAGVPTCGVISGAVMAFAAIDGYLQAQQLALGRAIGPFTFFRAVANPAAAPPSNGA